jgi:hypothetical protein
MDVVTYTGNSGTQILPNANSTPTSLNFSPGFLWIKTRSAGYSHVLTDKVRGDGKILFSNATAIEETTNRTALGTNNFTLIDDGSELVNHSPITYVGWAWDAGTSTVSNTQGSITSQVRANASAGFSVVTYTGSSTNNTVGHGLGVTPALVMVKPRTTSDFWVVYHSALNDLSKYLVLNSTAAAGTASNYWGTSGNWSSTTFGVSSGGGGNNNLTGVPTVAYCFAPVVGYSSFGNYVGNGSSDGPMVYTGMRPRFLIYKRTDAADTVGWIMIDSARDPYNVATKYIVANGSTAEGTTNVVDFLSNGFKLRVPGADGNVSGGTYIYAAFAESPLNYSRAR